MSSSISEDPTLERHFRGHRDGATSLDFNPNMKQLASGGLDCSVMLWNFRKDLRAFRLMGHKEPVTCVTYSRSGDRVASASKDRSVRLWVPTIEGKSSVFSCHVGAVRCVDFSPDDQRLLTASDDKSVKIWAIKTQRFMRSMSEHLNWVRCARFSSDGALVVSGSDDRTIKLWDPRMKASMHTFAEQPGAITSVAFHPSDYCLASAAANHVSVYDLRSHKLLQFHECSANEEPVRSVCFHPSGRYLLSGSDDASVRILDLLKGRLFYTVHGHQGAVNGVCFSRDGNYFATAGQDSLVTVWKTNFDTDELLDQGVIAETQNQHNDSLREIDASIMLAEGEDFEFEDHVAHYHNKNLDKRTSDYQDMSTLVGTDQNTSTLVEALQAMARQIELISQSLVALEHRMTQLEDKNELNDTLNQTLNL